MPPSLAFAAAVLTVFGIDFLILYSSVNKPSEGSKSIKVSEC